MQVKLDVGPPYGKIEVKVDLPSQYPFEPPKMAITSKIYHPNVYKDSGRVCMRWIFFNLKSLPWVGLIVAFSWAFYNLVRKKIKIDTDIGLLIESLYIFPFALIAFCLIAQNNLNDFNLNNLSLATLIILAGPMTLIPLFLYVKGVELSGLGPSGMVFFIVPTGQFLLGFFYFNENFSTDKFISFIFIWIAVLIYLRDLYENN